VDRSLGDTQSRSEDCEQDIHIKNVTFWKMLILRLQAKRELNIRDLMLRAVIRYISAKVSEEPTASVFRVEE
jgi:hypothetical protein